MIRAAAGAGRLESATSQFPDRCGVFDIHLLTSWSISRPVRGFGALMNRFLLVGCDNFRRNWAPCESKQPRSGRNIP